MVEYAMRGAFRAAYLLFYYDLRACLFPSLPRLAIILSLTTRFGHATTRVMTPEFHFIFMSISRRH